jgi:hypothetical protein
MVPKLMLDGMPYDLSEITPNTLDGDTSWNGKDSAEIMLFKLKQLDEAIVGQVPNNGYWISFVEIMDSNGDWFVPVIQYAFHVFFNEAYNDSFPWKIYNMLKIKNIYVRNTQGNNTWKLVNRTHGSRPIPDEDQVAQGFDPYGSQVSENSHIWTTVDAIDPSNWNSNGKPGASYVVSEWTDISSFAFRELLLRDIDPEEGELKMLIQVAADMNKFQAAINKEAI